MTAHVLLERVEGADRFTVRWHGRRRGRRLWIRLRREEGAAAPGRERACEAPVLFPLWHWRVEISAPPRMGRHGVRAEVERAWPWIRAQAAARREAAGAGCALPSRPAPGGRIPYRGRLLRMWVFPPGPGSADVRRLGAHLRVRPGETHDADVRGLLEGWFRAEGLRLLRSRWRRYHPPGAPMPRRLAVGAARDRWGSCSPGGVVSVHWRLVMAPAHVFDYVVAHELAHLAVPNHGPAFWALLARTYGPTAAARDWLRRRGAAGAD